VSAAEILRSLQVGPSSPGTESPELGDPGRLVTPRSPASARAASAPSPLPSASWQATTGGDPANKIKGAPALSGVSPADPQIAVSSKYEIAVDRVPHRRSSSLHFECDAFYCVERVDFVGAEIAALVPEKNWSRELAGFASCFSRRRSVAAAHRTGILKTLRYGRRRNVLIFN
jgi:hypothetical protein